MSKTEIDNRVATNMDLLAADSSLGHAIDIRREFCREAAATLRRLDAENKALRADAERYRWLRDFHNGPDGVQSQFPYIAAGDDEEFAWAFSGVTADAGIDAAMAAAKIGGAA